MFSFSISSFSMCGVGSKLSPPNATRPSSGFTVVRALAGAQSAAHSRTISDASPSLSASDAVSTPPDA